MDTPQAAKKLLDCMAKFYPVEDARHKAFLDWHAEHVGFGHVYNRAGSTSSGSESVRTDGEYTVSGSSSNYLVAMLEVKNELGGGDPDYQLQRYTQVCF